MESTELQLKIFQHIKSRLPVHLSLVDEIADLLGISNDSAYRRIRGDKQISLQEMQIIGKHFKLSLDQLLGLESNAITFYGNLVNKETFDFEKYLSDMLHQLELINGITEKTFYFEAKDIPVFHHFQNPQLAAFKYYFWMRTFIKDTVYINKSFEEARDYLLEHLHHLGKKIFETYIKIPSIEIWNVETVNSTLQQMEFYKDTGAFKNSNTAAMLFDELSNLVTHLESQAAAGEKFLQDSKPPGNNNNFKLFINEVMLGSNTTLIDSPDSRFCFINHNVFNYMLTYDKNFCDYTFDATRNLMAKSILISAVSEKERSKFFKTLREKIAHKKSGN